MRPRSFQKFTISLDCDECPPCTSPQTGVACHTGNAACFHRPLGMDAYEFSEFRAYAKISNVISVSRRLLTDGETPLGVL